jgi:hypothetical protein
VGGRRIVEKVSRANRRMVQSGRQQRAKEGLPRTAAHFRTHESTCEERCAIRTGRMFDVEQDQLADERASCSAKFAKRDDRPLVALTDVREAVLCYRVPANNCGNVPPKSQKPNETHQEVATLAHGRVSPNRTTWQGGFHWCNWKRRKLCATHVEMEMEMVEGRRGPRLTNKGNQLTAAHFRCANQSW